MVSLRQRVAKCDHLSKVLTVFCSSFVSVTQAQTLRLKRQLGDCYWVMLYDEPRTPDFTVYHDNAFCFDDNCLCVVGVAGEPCVSLYVGILYWPLQSAALTSALSITYIRRCVWFLLESALTTVLLTLVVIPFSKIGLSVGSRVIVKELLSQSSGQ